MKNVKRFKEIVTVLLKYGFDEIVRRMDLPGAGMVRKFTTPDRDVGLYERIRISLEALGPTFGKFGQIMRLRSDLLPKALLCEFEKLQDEVTAMPFNDVERVVRESLGKPSDAVFSVFDVTPIASASLSQVHRAVLEEEGHIVSVKVQRPGIRKTITADLDILEVLAGFLDQKFSELKAYDLPELVRVIRRQLMTEIDFTTELRNMNIARSFSADTPILIPDVYESYCTERLLVMEFVHGARYNEAIRGPAFDNQRIAKQGLAAAANPTDHQ